MNRHKAGIKRSRARTAWAAKQYVAVLLAYWFSSRIAWHLRGNSERDASKPKRWSSAVLHN